MLLNDAATREGFATSHPLNLGPCSSLSYALPCAAGEYLLSYISSNFSLGDVRREYDEVRKAPSRCDYRERVCIHLWPSHRVAFQEYYDFGIVLPLGAVNAQTLRTSRFSRQRGSGSRRTMRIRSKDGGESISPLPIWHTHNSTVLTQSQPGRGGESGQGEGRATRGHLRLPVFLPLGAAARVPPASPSLPCFAQCIASRRGVYAAPGHPGRCVHDTRGPRDDPLRQDRGVEHPGRKLRRHPWGPDELGSSPGRWRLCGSRGVFYELGRDAGGWGRCEGGPKCGEGADDDFGPATDGKAQTVLEAYQCFIH